jgi:hypothetical protein
MPKKKTHKSLKSQAGKAFPEAVKKVEALNERMENHPNIDFFADDPKYTPELEALLKPETVSSPLETYVDISDLEFMPGLHGPSFRYLYGSVPGCRDLEKFQKYQKPYLKLRESKVMFLRLSCNMRFDKIAQHMKMKTPTVRKLWQRTKTKIMKNEGDKVKELKDLKS